MTESVAYFIGAHSVILIVGLVIFIILTTFLLRHLFKRYSHYLWRMAARLGGKIRHSGLAQSLYRRYPNAGQICSRRLSARGYLILQLSLGFFLIFIFVALFITIAEAVVENKALVAFDQALSESLYLHAQAVPITFFVIITSLAGTTAYFSVGGVVGLILLSKRKYFLLSGWLIGVFGNSLLNNGLKLYFERPRPEFTEPLFTLPTWSFPSGHAMTAVVLYGLLTYLLFVFFESRVNKLLVMITTISLVLLIGFSRLYLGVHYFSDVIGGYAAGLSWLVVVISGVEIARRRRLNSTRSTQPQTVQQK